MEEDTEIERLRRISIDLLTKLYREIQIDEKGEVYFHGDCTREFVARELGYNSSQITRFVKEFCDQRPKQKAYDRFIKRLEVHLDKKRLREENEQLKNQIQQRTLPGTLTGASILSNGQLHNLLMWNGGLIIHKLGVEALIFNMEVREKKLTEEELRRELSELAIRVKYIIEESRNEIRGVHLLAPNGDNIADLFIKTYPLESLESNFDRMIPYLVSKTVAPRELIKRVGDESRSQQLKSWEKIQDLIKE